ncbi:uncharacterized protein LOC143918981 isoform X3 [Arctopsyche grandis]|uniref:uncharacterized protein LOC143918981 isoform X3 n=1 Tax=Arctopsyche grandis TaxID=121162 RepID=UPI00406D9700
MGQCVSRNPMAPYAGPYDASSVIGLTLPVAIYDEYYYAGQSDSKGARKRSSTPSGKGAAMSFGFRKNKNGSKGSNAVAPSTGINMADKNGNGGSTEELYTGSPILSGRSTPLARPRKESSGQPLRTNRFGFRQSTIPKTAKVADINISAEQVLTANQETKNNNFNADKISQKPGYNSPVGLIPTQVGSTGLANINPAPRQTKTVILTYSAKQHPIVPNPTLRSKSPAVPRVTSYPNYNSPRSVSASRAYTNSTGYNIDMGGYKLGNSGKYTFQTSQFPKPQYPVKVLDTKSAKQVANNSRKVYGSSDGSSKEGSVTEDSGVSGLGDNGCNDRVDSAWSPQLTRRQHRRPRTLEMIMHGDHNFHLRELQVNDLDIMVNDVLDEAIVTDNDVIPLPKLPSNFDKDREDAASYYQVPENRFSSCRSSGSSSSGSQQNRSHQSTLERYRSNRDRDRLPRGTRDADETLKYKDEEKGSRDRIQHEKLEKQDYNKTASSNQDHSPLTRNSSKDSSPSTKSEESQPSTVGSTCSDPLEAWVNQTAGESMALRSHDDISVALSLSSSCDDDKGVNKSFNTPSFTPTTVTIVNKEPPIEYAHPLTMKPMSLSQNHGLHSMFMSSSMSSSAFSADSTSLIASDFRNLMIGDSRLAMPTLTSSNHSLIEDETSPADSLISSSTDSNNEMPMLEKDTTVSTSAYHTADNRTLDVNKEDDTTMEDNMKDKETTEKFELYFSQYKYIQRSPNKKSSHSPDTPTNASNSLSLSEGRDFLIDDEIADQPALIFEGNSIADQATSSLQLINLNGTDSTQTLQETNNQSSAHKAKGVQTNHKETFSPLRPKRSPSLDTLSPCDSIASDDLIMDMDFNNSITSLNSVDEYIDRLDGSIRSGLNSLEDSQLREELLKLSVKKYSSQILNGEFAIGGTPVKQGQSMSTSNNSLVNITAMLPTRTGRLLSRSRAGTPESPLLADGSRASSVTAPSAPGGGTPDDAMRLERATHGSMLHDIVTIKTMLLKLKRVLQEPDEGLNLMRTETLNPLDSQRDISPLKNGPSLRLGELGEASPPPPPPAPHEEVADLRRQLVFLQSQLEERERMVKLLQYQMSKYNEQNSGQTNGKCSTNNSASEDMCNVATQTERLRPTSQGPNALQSLNSDVPPPGSIVSWNEQYRSIQSPSNIRQSSSSPTPCMKKQTISSVSSPVSSDCETVMDSKINNKNGLSNRTTQNTYREYSPNKTDGPVHMKTNCRVGSKYLQAIANKQSNHFNGDTLVNGKTTTKTKPMYSRSKSIENFGNHYTFTTSEPKIDAFNTKNSQLRSKKHHTSYNNLLNGVSNGNKSDHVNGNGCHAARNGYANGNMTDTDDTSDSGYKSLPPSINIMNHSKISGIPRRTLTSDLRFTQPKQAQTNQC